MRDSVGTINSTRRTCLVYTCLRYPAHPDAKHLLTDTNEGSDPPYRGELRTKRPTQIVEARTRISLEELRTYPPRVITRSQRQQGHRIAATTFLMATDMRRR